jgi:hypothetical protein
MLYRLSELIRKRIYGRLERESIKIRETIGTQQKNTQGRTESSIGSMVSRSNETKIPDPWFN